VIKFVVTKYATALPWIKIKDIAYQNIVTYVCICSNVNLNAAILLSKLMLTNLGNRINQDFEIIWCKRRQENVIFVANANERSYLTGPEIIFDNYPPDFSDTCLVGY